MNGQINQGASASIQPSSLNTLAMEHQISDDIIKMLHQLPSDRRIQKSYISKVHSQLRGVNEKAYDPVLVSIGPYHYERRESDLQSMERHKLRYLGNLIKRRKGKDGISEADQLREYVWILGELEVEARGCYEEVVTLTKEAFINMLLVDACFIIELFQRAAWSRYEDERKTDPLFKADWIIQRLKGDLILVENQIPFFVLEKLYPKFGDIKEAEAFIFLAVNYLPIYEHISQSLQDNATAIAAKSIVDLCPNKFFGFSPTLQRSIKLRLKGFKHLLDLTRKFMLIEEKLEMKLEMDLLSGRIQQHSLLRLWLEPKEEGTPAHYKKYIYSATELRDLGVRFKGVEKSKFYEIRFENGVLEIPVFSIDDSTETLFRNLIAYEEHGHCKGESLTVTIDIGNYMTFMDGLIDTAKDVELLRRYGIIESFLGDDEQIATIFNNMGKNMTFKSECYRGIVHQLTNHCRKRRNVWMAKLRRNYLHSPWEIMSVIAAIVLLLSTITQTVYSVISYYHKA